MWKERFVRVTSDGKLLWFDSFKGRKPDDQVKPRGTIDLHQATGAAISHNGKNDAPREYLFEVRTPQQTFYWFAETPEKRNQWIRAITFTSKKMIKSQQDSLQMIWGESKRDPMEGIEAKPELTTPITKETLGNSPQPSLELPVKAPVLYSCADPSQRSIAGIHQRNMQILTFTNWVNYHLKSLNVTLTDLVVDLTNGVNFIHLVEVLTKTKIDNVVEKPEGSIEKMHNVNSAVSVLQEKLKVTLPPISASSIVAGNVKAIMDLIWSIIYTLEIKSIAYGGLEDRFALLSWCQDTSNTYKNVAIKDFANSFAEGLAFCALIHAYGPSLIDFEALEAYKKMDNLRLAFKIAHERWDIPELLVYQDFKEAPDETSVIIYLAQWYHKLNTLGESEQPIIKHSIDGATTIPDNNK